VIDLSKPRGICHIAGPYRDLVQHCARCGVLLCDDRNAAWPVGDPAPKGWAEGALVCVDGPASWFVDEMSKDMRACGAQA